MAPLSVGPSAARCSVAFGRPRGAGDVAQPGRGEVEGGLAIGECTDHTGAPPDLSQIARADFWCGYAAMLLREGVVGERLLDRRCHDSAALVRRRPRSLSITWTAFCRAAAVSSPAWIALSMAAISRNLAAGTWLKIFRYQSTMQRCHAASGKNSAALSASPMQASEMISRTPVQPAALEMLEEARSSPPCPPWRLRRCRESPDNPRRSPRSPPAATRCGPRQPSCV